MAEREVPEDCGGDAGGPDGSRGRDRDPSRPHRRKPMWHRGVYIVYQGSSKQVYRRLTTMFDPRHPECARHAHISEPMETSVVPLVREAGVSSLCARSRAPQAL